MIDILITTILKRPYVLAFLISYLIIATKSVGLRWTLKFLITGYTIAFISEYLSINCGFPYGWYFYKYENLQGEWLNNGVPVWDSVSYVFMCFAGLYAAAFALRQNNLTISNFQLTLLSALLVTLLDVIVDPVAHLGRLWFLGDIYYYPNPGRYFDVTFANFMGWFLVSFLINACGCFVFQFQKHMRLNPTNSFLALGLYYGIFGFGVAIAIYLQQWLLLACDLAWIGLTVLIVSGKLKIPFATKSVLQNPS